MTQTKRVYVPGSSAADARPFMSELIFSVMTIQEDGGITVINNNKRGSTVAQATIWDIQDGAAFMSFVREQLQFVACQEELEANARSLQIGGLAVGAVKVRNPAGGVSYTLWRKAV